MDKKARETSNLPEPITRTPTEDGDDDLWDSILAQLKTDSKEQPQARRRFEAGGQ